MRTFIPAGFALAVVVLLLKATLDSLGASQQADSDRLVADAYRTQKEIVAVLSALKDAETGQRGFLLTGEESYLEPYLDAAAAVPERLRRLRELSGDDDPARLALLDVLDALAREKLDELAGTIRVYRTKGRPAALEVEKSGRGKAIMDRARDVVGRLEADEERLLRERAAQARSDLAFTLAASASTAAVTAALFVLVYLLVRRHDRDRGRAEAELREAVRRAQRSEGWFAQVWDQTRDAVRLTDGSGVILLANPAYCALVGRPREAVEGTNFSELYAESERDQARLRHQDRFAGRSVEPLLTQEVTLWDGRKAHLEFSNSFVNLPGEPPLLLSVIRDVGARVALEARYRQAQKMEAVGRLAGGVAHDFNNLLTVINGYGEILLGRVPAGDPTRALLKEVVAAGDRAAGLTRQLLAFSRKQIVSPQILDLNAVVQDTDKLLRRLIGEDVELATVPGPALWQVRADPGQVEQVLVNLAVNARDAMPTGGKLTVETRNVELDEEYARTRADARTGPHVLLAVSDTGCGMDAATQARVFEPFFTTKGDKGTGLGLATVYGIIKQAGGHVGVYSEPGGGTTFKVYLPQAAEGESAPHRAERAEKALPRGGGETVLLVEDEDGVRALARHVLAGCGYAVLEARDGEEALRVAAAHVGRIDLLLTDVVMPRMAGREVAGRLSAARPGLRVLFLSGYTDDAVVRHGILQDQVQFLQKPYSPAALAQKVRDVLGG